MSARPLSLNSKIEFAATVEVDETCVIHVFVLGPCKVALGLQPVVLGLVELRNVRFAVLVFGRRKVKGRLVAACRLAAAGVLGARATAL